MTIELKTRKHPRDRLVITVKRTAIVFTADIDDAGSTFRMQLLPFIRKLQRMLEDEKAAERVRCARMSAKQQTEVNET